ncbi:MAG TPA: nucleotide exchange factor GrpE [Planctomycetota bacterium]|jgi:molecular chaperone GrpE|nr:nucleotide exchange factor GrpE [Planctomycetota bacterium]
MEPEEEARLRREAAEYLDLARRWKAEFLNYQDRVRREREEWKRRAVEEFVRDFLPAIDSFVWARFEEPTLMRSLKILEREFLRVLARHGIVPIEAEGRPFDPFLHEAVAVEETDEHPDGTVLEEIRPGWMMHGRVLRPAAVRVARARSGRASGG